MSENQVKISYKPLWKLLIDRDMTKTELRKRTQIAPSTFTKMNNDQQVSSITVRIWQVWLCSAGRNMSSQGSGMPTATARPFSRTGEPSCLQARLV